MAYVTIGRIAHDKKIHLALTARPRQGYDEDMVLKRFLSRWPLREATHSHWREAVIAGLVVIVLAAGTAALAVARQEAARQEAWGSASGGQVEIVHNRPLRAVYAVPTSAVSAGLPQPAQGSPGQARVQIPTDFYDFGLIGARAVVHRDFLVVNQGSAPLVILQAYTTCGCTSADLSATIIPPGKASRVTVTFDAGFHPVAGQTVRRGLVLETNDPGRPEAEIWVQASVGTR